MEGDSACKCRLQEEDNDRQEDGSDTDSDRDEDRHVNSFTCLLPTHPPLFTHTSALTKVASTVCCHFLSTFLCCIRQKGVHNRCLELNLQSDF